MMSYSRSRLGRMAWSSLLSAAACLASGGALATCNPSLSGITPGDGMIPCFITVQPFDMCTSGGAGCAPFNTTSTIGNPSTAGFSPHNETSSNPVGFVVDPLTGLSPGQTNYPGSGVDVTRALLNNIGIDITWNQMVQYNSPSGTNLTTLQVTQGASCTGRIDNGTAGHTGTTLTVASCSFGVLGVGDTLSGSGITSGTTITGSYIATSPGATACGTCTGGGGAGTYQVSQSQKVSSTTITSTSTLLQSQNLLTLSQQTPSTSRPPMAPCAIYQMTIPPSSPCNGPSSPLNVSGEPSTMNLFFVSKINPPVYPTTCTSSASSCLGGTLYGQSWNGHNGGAIAGSTFASASPPRPDTITHELLHMLGFNHNTYGAGFYNPAAISNTPPGGTPPPIPANPILMPGECDSLYPACGANLMTQGSLRTEPSVACVLAGYMGEAVPPACSGMPGLANTTAPADQVTPLSTSFGFQNATSAQLPTPQQQAVLGGGSGLLDTLNSGFLDPIPYETTKVQFASGGGSAGRAIFDLSAPAGGQPGETLVAWVLTLPQGQTFAGHDRFDIISQSRADLVQSVHYYPEVETHPLLRNIAYDPSAGDKPSIETAADSPCAFAISECLIVKFQAPGLGAHDSISFSKSILSGGAPIANDELCKAKITYVFSDGYATTSNLRPCPAASLPLIASSWRPDPRVSPHKVKTDMLLAQRGIVLAAAPAAQKIPPGGDPGTNNPPPTGAIYDLNGTPIPGGGNNTYQMYTVNFTATLNNTAITFAFREDPAFISFSNASVTDLTVPGGNLLANGNFAGGTYSNNGNTSTPIGWTYANVYGAFAGGVVNSNCGVGATGNYGVGNCWFDGAVQAYDAISQTIATTPGHQYQISFWVADNSGCETNGVPPCNFSDVSTNGDTTDTGGNGINVTVYAQAGLPPATAVGAWTPGPNGQPLFPPPAQGGVADSDTSQEIQPGQSCNNGATPGTNYASGTINGNVTIPANNLHSQQCNYTKCTITGNLTINPGGSISLQNCTVEGNITENGGSLTLASTLASPDTVDGNLNISGASSFNILPGTVIDGNLQIQSLPGTVPQPGTVCGTHVHGGVTVQNNASPIQIGGITPVASCGGNTINGQLQCQGNTGTLTGGGNTVGGHAQGQCATFTQ